MKSIVTLFLSRFDRPGEEFGGLAGGDDVVVEARLRVGHDRVLIERSGERHGLLRDDAEHAAQFVGGESCIPSGQ